MILTVFYKKKNGGIHVSFLGEVKFDFKVFGDLEKEHKEFLDVVYYENASEDISHSIGNYKVNLKTRQLELKTELNIEEMKVI